MTSRREFVRGGLALSTLGAIPLRARASGSAAARPAPVIAVADRAFTATVEFAAEASRHGIDARGFDGDIGGLWLRLLEPEIAAGRSALVGLTGAGVLFCLETMAAAHGFRAVFRRQGPAQVGGWTRVATRHALASAASPYRRAALPPFEHVVPRQQAEPALFVWAIAAARPSRTNSR
jgi:hypothetical protein